MIKAKLYCTFQYFVTFMALLCLFVSITNTIFSINDDLKSLAAIFDVAITLIIVKKLITPNCH